MVPPRKRKEALTLVSNFCSIGNCTVEFPTHVEDEHSIDCVRLHVQDAASITITVENREDNALDKHLIRCETCNQGSTLPRGLSFVLLNPKSLSEPGRLLLQDVLQLYHQELPAMSFAANTGKVSHFLERCLTSGKYCTLLVTRSGATTTNDEVVGAITYQILPPDTQFAEIPLAAVCRTHQRQGLGACLFKELAKRLMDVGVMTLFCWGDQESEAFWSRQGFLKVAEVDGRGKPRKLPIKAEIRKAMCLPGSATLMICHFSTAFAPLTSSVTSMHTDIILGDESLADRALAASACGDGMRAPSEVTHAGTLVTPVTGSKSSGGTAPTITLCSLVPYSNASHPWGPSPFISNEDSVKAGVRLKAAARRNSSVPPADSDIPGGNTPAVTTPRFLEFSGDDKPVELAPVKPAPAKGVVTPVDGIVPSEKIPAPQLGAKLPSPGLSISTPKAEDAKLTFDVTPSEELPSGGRALGNTMAPLNMSGLFSSVSCKQPSVDNSLATSALTPTRKKPSSKVKATAVPGKSQVSMDPRKENREPSIREVLDAERDALGGTPAPLPGARSSSLSVPIVPPPEKLSSGSRSLGTTIAPLKMTGVLPSVTCKEPLKGIDNSLSTSLVSPLRKRPLPKARVNASEVAATIPGKTRGSVGYPTRMGNKEPTIREVLDAERAARGAMIRAANKRSISPVKVVGRRSTRCRRGYDPGCCKLVSKTMEDGLHSQIEGSLSTMDKENHRTVGVHQSATEGMTGTANKLESNRYGDATLELNTQESTGEPAQAPTGARDDSLDNAAPRESPRHVIMFMNMANETRRVQLTEFVEKLGGRVTSEGCQCTHVITGEVRTTLNFCTALCSGSWVVSPDWLKASSKQNHFVDEKPFVLKDKQFESKYKITVANAVQKARQKPHGLLQGFYVYPTPNVQPSLNIICQLAQSAGAKVFSSLDEVLSLAAATNGFVVACEEDMEEAIVAAKAGLRTFNAEWFLSSIMKQDFDLNASQFTESL